MEHLLLPTQRNDVFETIREAGLNPGDFKWIMGVYYTQSREITTRGKRITNNCPKLQFRDSYYFFQFELPDSQHYYTCCPGSDSFGEKGNPGRWPDQLQAVRAWAIRLKEEIEAPDSWTEMAKYQVVVSPDIPENALNEVLSVSDAEDIAGKLQIVGDEIQKLYNLTSEQDHFVRGKLNLLEDAAKRVRSKEWVCIALSIFQIIAMGLTLTPEQVQQLTDLLKTVFGSFINLIGGST